VRTTVDLDNDILEVARHLSQERSQSLGRVLSDLVREGLRPAAKVAYGRGGIPVLPRKPNARPVTSQMVKDLLETDN
jgi:hypothetical protein